MKKSFKTSSSSIDTPTENIDTGLQKEFEDKIKNIIREELSWRTKEKQEKIQNQISTFVLQHTKNGNYVELPYYLLIQAQKAGFGDLQKLFFGRKNNKLQILGMKSELSEGNHLAANYQILTPQREKFSHQEQIFINRVEKAHQKLQSLRTLQGWNSHEDELDLPKEIETLIGDKYKEREKFKTELCYYDPELVTTSDTIQKYEDFAKYFEELYTGILLSLTSFKTSNDVDKFSLYQAALEYGKGSFLDNQGNLQQNSDLKLLSNSKFRTFYKEQLNKQRIGTKNLNQLWRSKENADKKLAHQASITIITVYLEKAMLNKNSQGKIENIKIGGHRRDGDLENPLKHADQLSGEIRKRLKDIQLNPPLEKEKIEALIQNSVQIKNLEKKENEIVHNISPLQKQIESTAKNIVWQDQRGNIIYDPEKNQLSSRGTSTIIEEKNGKIELKGLEINLSIKEAIWLANFNNWIKHKYPKGKFAFEIENAHDAIVLQNGQSYLGISDDVEIISQDSLKKYCQALKEDNEAKKLVAWLNGQAA